jgi:hypothetical protein
MCAVMARPDFWEDSGGPALSFGDNDADAEHSDEVCPSAPAADCIELLLLSDLLLGLLKQARFVHCEQVEDRGALGAPLMSAGAPYDIGHLSKGGHESLRCGCGRCHHHTSLWSASKSRPHHTARITQCCAIPEKARRGCPSLPKRRACPGRAGSARAALTSAASPAMSAMSRTPMSAPPAWAPACPARTRPWERRLFWRCSCLGAAPLLHRL